MLENSQNLNSANVLHPLIYIMLPNRSRAAVTSLWRLDSELASILQKANDPHLQLMRLVWWRDNFLALEAGSKFANHPLLLDLNRNHPNIEDRKGLHWLAEIWADFVEGGALDVMMIKKFAAERGGYLFEKTAQILNAEDPKASAPFGSVWGLWDVAAHLQDRELATKIFMEAALLGNATRRSGVPKPLRASAKLSKMRAIAGGIVRPLPEQLMLLRLSLLGD